MEFEPVSLEAIPVLETGIEYPASTGPFSVTSEMLAEVIASQDDPHILPPRINIGHSTIWPNPLDAELQDLWEEVNKTRDPSMPSLGTIQNMVASDDGQTLIGDFFGLPKWLADILMTAYPARSIEGGSWKNPANNKEYDFTLTAVALLGVVGPGCTSLDDLQELFSEEGPKVTVIEMAHKQPDKGGPMSVIAQVNVEDIRRAFYDGFAQGDRYWWWDREILIDPEEMIVEDDEGDLHRLPIELGEGDGTDAISFGDPSPIKIQYVPDPAREPDEEAEVAATRLIAPQLERAGKVLAVNTQPPRRRKEEPIMDGLREKLGLPEDASDEDVSRRIEELRAEENGGGGETDPQPDPDPEAEPAPDPDESGEGEGEGEGEEQPAEGAVANVDPATLAQLQTDAAAGREARQQQLTQERDTYLAAAVKAGKFPPARLAHYQTLYEADRDGTRTLIDSLAEGLVPVEESGGSGEGAMSSSAYPENWLSLAEKQRKEAAIAAGSGSIQKENV